MLLIIGNDPLLPPETCISFSPPTFLLLRFQVVNPRYYVASQYIQNSSRSESKVAVYLSGCEKPLEPVLLNERHQGISEGGFVRSWCL